MTKTELCSISSSPVATVAMPAQSPETRKRLEEDFGLGSSSSRLNRDAASVRPFAGQVNIHLDVLVGLALVKR